MLWLDWHLQAHDPWLFFFPLLVVVVFFFPDRPLHFMTSWTTKASEVLMKEHASICVNYNLRVFYMCRYVNVVAKAA